MGDDIYNYLSTVMFRGTPCIFKETEDQISPLNHGLMEFHLLWEAPLQCKCLAQFFKL